MAKLSCSRLCRHQFLCFTKIWGLMFPRVILFQSSLHSYIITGKQISSASDVTLASNKALLYLQAVSVAFFLHLFLLWLTLERVLLDCYKCTWPAFTDIKWFLYYVIIAFWSLGVEGAWCTDCKALWGKLAILDYIKQWFPTLELIYHLVTL